MVANKVHRIAEPAHLLRAVRQSIQQAGDFLVSRIAPNGPIMRERNLNYIHKTTWGMFSAGVDHSIIARLLDWARDEALQPSGDFYFLEESPEYKVIQRAYRPLTFGKVAAWIGHPVIQDERVVNRILQYQHVSGGVFNYIGDDPANIEQQPVLGALNTSFFGHVMLALGRKDEAIAAGDWLRRFVDANRESIAKDTMYTQATLDGELIKDVQPGEKMAKVVDNLDPKQEF